MSNTIADKLLNVNCKATGIGSVPYKKIIDYRLKNDLTQEQLAKEIGVTQQHISKIENNEFSSFPTLFRVLLYIGFKVKVEIEPIPLKPAEKKRIRYTIRKLQTA